MFIIMKLSILTLTLFTAVTLGDDQHLRLHKPTLLHAKVEEDTTAEKASTDSFFDEEDALFKRVLQEGMSMPPDSSVCEDTVFDFVVIGSGPAGASAAYKLSEDRNNRVLLLEEGGYSLYPNKGVQEIWRGTDGRENVTSFISYRF
jgi:hypothetical protein